MENGLKHCCNLSGSTLSIFIKHFEREVLCKNSFLVKHKILRLFVNTFTADDKHYLLKRDNWAQRIQIQLSQKQKTFPEFLFFFAFLKYILNFKDFSKKGDPHC